MTTEDKLLKLKKLADAMYYAAQHLTTDASRLHKAMDEYNQFIIHDCKEEPMSEQKLSNVERIGKNWKEESDLNWKDMSLQEKKDLLALLQKDIEPISEDLETEITSLFDKISYLGKIHVPPEYNDEKIVTMTVEGFAELARHFSNWQKEQTMKDALDAVVKIDAGGYPYVDATIELYDYDKDIPLAKEGDKVKIFLIKE